MRIRKNTPTPRLRRASKKILFAAQDPGGFNSLANVIKRLKKEKFDFKVLLANESRFIAKKNRIKFIDCSDKNEKEIKVMADEFAPDLIFTATSMGLSLDKKVLGWAKLNKVKSISIIDFWSNYRIRFSAPGIDDLEYLPDAICVIDEYMKKRMISDGFKKEKLFITGNPFFDALKKKKKEREKYILFASQPFSEAPAKNTKFADVSAFNEVDIFSDVIKILEGAGNKLPIFISFHPREKKRDKFNKIVSRSKLKIEIAKKDTADMFGGAKMIIGINTMILFQAALAGKYVISFQPSIKKERDPLISNHLKLSSPAYSYDELLKLLKNAKTAVRADKKIIDKYLKNNSTEKVINIVNRFIK